MAPTATPTPTRRRRVLKSIIAVCKAVRGGRYHVHRGGVYDALFAKHRFVVSVIVQDGDLNEANPALDFTDAIGKSTMVLDFWMSLKGTPDELEDDWLDQMQDDAVWVVRRLVETIAAQHGFNSGIDFAGARYREFAAADFTLQGVTVTFPMSH